MDFSVLCKQVHLLWGKPLWATFMYVLHLQRCLQLNAISLESEVCRKYKYLYTKLLILVYAYLSNTLRCYVREWNKVIRIRNLVTRWKMWPVSLSKCLTKGKQPLVQRTGWALKRVSREESLPLPDLISVSQHIVHPFIDSCPGSWFGLWGIRIQFLNLQF
jgi:hypothetical protein